MSTLKIYFALTRHIFFSKFCVICQKNSQAIFAGKLNSLNRQKYGHFFKMAGKCKGIGIQMSKLTAIVMLLAVSKPLAVSKWPRPF